jgi:hypothetical protein
VRGLSLGRVGFPTEIASYIGPPVVDTYSTTGFSILSIYVVYLYNRDI